jgi:peptidoglycan/xylan/chitin deacetylase (PgdA/CDA1 family)
MAAELERVTGNSPTCLRPPEGRFDDNLKEVCQTLEYPIVLWSVDSEDWKSRNADSVCNRIIGKVKDGDIILCHDLYSSTAEATKRFVPALIDAGFQLVTVEELGLLKTSNGLENGVVYYSVGQT